jgi:hypothetical protein
MRKTGAENRIDLSMRALGGLMAHDGRPPRQAAELATLEPVTKGS